MSTQNESSEKPAEDHNLARQGTVVAGFTLLSRVSGLVRDVFFAYLLGASQFADIFLVAFRIPNFFRRMFAEGAFNQAFVPVLMRYKEKGQKELLGFLAALSGLFAVLMLAVVGVGLLLAEQLAWLFAPGFSDNEGAIAATTHLIYITFPYLGLISLVAYAGAVLNAHNHFAIPAATPILLNLVLIGAATLALGGATGMADAQALAWGVLLAGVVQLVFQVPSLVRLGLLPKPSLDHRHEGVRRVRTLLLPALFASSVAQINALVNTILASTLMTGSITWLYYADRLLELPVGLVAIALGTVLLPHLSRLAATGDEAWFKATLSWGIGLGLMLGLPAAGALYLLGEALIASLYLSIGGGALTAHDARMAGHALMMFAIALPGFVLVRVLSPAFFANEDTKTPFKCAAGSVAANLMASLATFSWFGHVGLAWATAVAAWVNVLLLYVALRRRGMYAADAGVWSKLWRSLVASSLLGLGLYFGFGDWQWLEMDPTLRLVWVLGISAGGVITYAALLFLLGVRPHDLQHSAVQKVAHE